MRLQRPWARVEVNGSEPVSSPSTSNATRIWLENDGPSPLRRPLLMPLKSDPAPRPTNQTIRRCRGSRGHPVLKTLDTQGSFTSSGRNRVPGNNPFDPARRQRTEILRKRFHSGTPLFSPSCQTKWLRCPDAPRKIMVARRKPGPPAIISL
jgi:hypothetical protein